MHQHLRIPGPLDDLTGLALTIYQEAAGESYEGKLAVGWVCMTRAGRGRSILDVIFDPYDFSAWNTDSPTRMALDTINPHVWRDCFKAACAAFFAFQEDPTKGADHYLNTQVVLSRRGSLPSWYDENKVTVVIGRHTFLRLND